MVDRSAVLPAKRQTTRSFELRKKFRLYVTTCIVSLSVVLIWGEILVRVLHPYNNPDTLKKRSLQRIGSLFSRDLLKPTQFVVKEGDSKDKGQEQNYGYFINSVGYRGPDFAVRKPEGIIRIIVIGGSSVFDQQAKDTSSGEANDWPAATPPAAQGCRRWALAGGWAARWHDTGWAHTAGARGWWKRPFEFPIL